MAIVNNTFYTIRIGNTEWLDRINDSMKEAVPLTYVTTQQALYSNINHTHPYFPYQIPSSLLSSVLVSSKDLPFAPTYGIILTDSTTAGLYKIVVTNGSVLLEAM